MRKYPILLLVFLLTGCASTLRTAPTYSSSIKEIKTIAVMPPDIKVYKITAGGVQELIDEWSDEAKQYIKEALERHLSQTQGVAIKFVDEKWLKENHKDIWRKNRALYSAISMSALLHAYPGENEFPAKRKNFDYTLGPDIKELSQVCEGDALLFIYGFDNEATVGRQALWWFNITMALATGVAYLPINPSGMAVGLVNAQTGNLEWLKVTPADTEYSFRNSKSMDTLIEWITRDLAKKK